MSVHRKHILRFRAVDKANFLEIRTGKKRVETRAATSRYRKIEKGDILSFVCGKSRLNKRIKRVEIFKTIGAMLRKYKIRDIMPGIISIKEMKRVYYTYPQYREKIRKFGIIAFILK